jgi:hypothetical protein
VISLYINTLKQIMLLFPNSIKSRFWKVQVLIVFTSVIDVFGLAAFMPVIAAIANPKLLSTNSIFHGIEKYGWYNCR